MVIPPFDCSHLVANADQASKSASFGEYLAPGTADRRVAAMGFYHVLGENICDRLSKTGC